ncbi:Na+/H+ antiporter NhaC family protein [Gallibacterium salpingitidis]|uniref:Na+/H+ antiporter NhaC-like C-terminal domain-containing protein n=1 Tax=Gallibacterium salpingitidis TaxID=505341 RepID=A0A1A7NRI3_9PAST|nr:Na+/H+ antiporter NhaC family protein [Gallibacterium salpingitidis]OBW92131.1 hypothetical protein QS62_09330 [Gallibacterium salpingitidis]
MELIDYSSSIWSVVPPLLALTLAMITRRVLLSLSVGIIVGALMLTAGSPLNAAIYIKNSVLSLVYGEEGLNHNNVNIIIFLLMLGALTSLLTVSGSNQAFASWAQKHIKGRRGAKLLTACLVFFTFIDDYFHSLAVGAIARPVTDKFKVSRAKLAYILDSTAAPMCVLMPISSWGAYIMTLVAGLLTTHAIAGYSPMGAFVAMSAMNYYALFALFSVFFVAYFSFDIGSMARHERQAMQAEHQDESSDDEDNKGSVGGLIIPIVVLIIGTVSMMMYTGYEALAANGQGFSVLGAFENTTVGISLVVGSLAAFAVASLFVFNRISVTDYIKAILLGFKSMSGAITILFFAWTINTIVGDVNTGKYLASLVSGNMMTQLLPALLFLLAIVMAFSTGTSWGTFGIMLPIAAAMAANADPSLMLPCLSAVMAGAVCGDHCSPVSDTTILSSTGAACNHIDHVNTQLPYAAVVAIASFVGFICLGFTSSAILGFVTTAVVLAVLFFIFRSRQQVLA